MNRNFPETAKSSASGQAMGTLGSGGLPSSFQRPLLAAGVLLALGLLASFYLVISQGVERGQQHWAEASGSARSAPRSEACGSDAGRSAPQGCRSTALDVRQGAGAGKLSAMNLAR